MNFTKHDNDKPRMELLPPRAIEEVAKVLTFGAEKYDDDNWRKVPNPRRYVSAALRHVFAYLRGETQDPESGLHHLAAAACSLLFIVDLELGAEPVAEEAPCRFHWDYDDISVMDAKGVVVLSAYLDGRWYAYSANGTARVGDGEGLPAEAGIAEGLQCLLANNVITEAEYRHLLDTAPGGAGPVAEETPCRWEWLKANWGVRYIVPRGQEELHASYIGSLTSRGWSAYERPEDGAPFDEGDSGLIGLLDSLRKHDVITEAEHQHLLDTAPDA